MSTGYILHKDGDKEVEVVEGSARYSLDLYGYGDDGCYEDNLPCVFGPQLMDADTALQMAARIMYAVWCSYPDKADAMATALAQDIPRGAGKT